MNNFLTKPVGQLPRWVLWPACGVSVGLLVAALWNPLPWTPRTQLFPAPYRLAKVPGGTALRMAMVHDVLHERYLRHGVAWYAKRNEIARAAMAREAPVAGQALSAAYLDAADDLAVGLQQIGRISEGIEVLRAKYVLLQPMPAVPATQPSPIYSNALAELNRIVAADKLPWVEHHRYTTCANLGTLLLLDALSQLLAGDKSAAVRQEIIESRGMVDRAVAINPGGHFGREPWQAALIRFVIQAMDEPSVLAREDMLGQKLQGPRGIYPIWRFRWNRDGPALLEALANPALPDEARAKRREWVPRMREGDLDVPFDEPTLAIVGMWTIGGGPNPHFALALATMMTAIEQREIAWNGYERCVELADGFWPDAKVRDAVVSICRKRQAEIAAEENKADPAGWEATMRTRHHAELAWGEAYQKAYQAFEANKIAEGVPLDAAQFYEPFFAGRAPIASSPGLADDVWVTRKRGSLGTDFLPCGVLGLGLGMMGAAAFPRKRGPVA